MAKVFSEEVIAYGENSRGFGILCQSDNDQAPVIVMFNAGLLHRSEPYGLNKELARRAADIGFDSIRFDLSGKGDTPSRDGLSNRESVARDWQALKSALEGLLEKRSYILMGLCSGADNAIKTAASDTDVKGLILLDALAPAASASQVKRVLRKLSNPWFWLRVPGALWARVRDGLSGLKKSESVGDESSDRYALRDLPTSDEFAGSFQRILQAQGGILCVFTNYSIDSYTHSGQIREHVLGAQESDANLVELSRPDVDHLFSLSSHREFLTDFVVKWLERSTF